MDPSKHLPAYSYGSVGGEQRDESTDSENGGPNAPHLPIMNQARQPLSRKVPIPSSKMEPVPGVHCPPACHSGILLPLPTPEPCARCLLVMVHLTSVLCDICFATSWILDQLPKWQPITRETELYRLTLRFDGEGEPSQLRALDVFVTTAHPTREPPLITANTVLSILAMDYPVKFQSCYVSDDAGALVTLHTLSEIAQFAKKWVPFWKKFNIEPRAPQVYFGLETERDHMADLVFLQQKREMN